MDGRMFEWVKRFVARRGELFIANCAFTVALGRLFIGMPPLFLYCCAESLCHLSCIMCISRTGGLLVRRLNTG